MDSTGSSEFSLDSLHDMDVELENVLKQMRGTLNITDIGNMKPPVLMKQNKDTLVKFVQRLTDIVSRSQLVLKSAAAKIDELKSDNLKTQGSLINLQNDMIHKNSEQLDSVKNAVQSEIKTWATVVSKRTSTCNTKTVIKEAVKSAVGDEDRARNFMVYGAKEVTEEFSTTDTQWVKGIFHYLKVEPEVIGYYRVGPTKAGCNRPIKVKLLSPDSVMEVVTSAKKMKVDMKFWSIFLAPDRSLDERVAHKQLIDGMKKKREEEPSRYFFIKQGKVCSVERTEKQ